MTPNADRFTLPSSDLIVHGRIVHPVRATCNCTRQLADALEASERQVARLETWRARAISLYPELAGLPLNASLLPEEAR